MNEVYMKKDGKMTPLMLAVSGSGVQVVEANLSSQSVSVGELKKTITVNVPSGYTLVGVVGYSFSRSSASKYNICGVYKTGDTTIEVDGYVNTATTISGTVFCLITNA